MTAALRADSRKPTPPFAEVEALGQGQLQAAQQGQHHAENEGGADRRGLQHRHGATPSLWRAAQAP